MKAIADPEGEAQEAFGCLSLEVEQGFQSGEPATLRGSRTTVLMKPKGATPDPTGVVDRPAHYARFKIEPIYFIMENDLSFPQGNVIKYVCRADAKNGVEDLRKARRYLDMMIKEAEGDPEYAG